MLHADDAAECVGHTGQMFQNADVVSRADQAATAAARAAEDSRMRMVAEHEAILQASLDGDLDTLLRLSGEHMAQGYGDALRTTA